MTEQHGAPAPRRPRRSLEEGQELPDIFRERSEADEPTRMLRAIQDEGATEASAEAAESQTHPADDDSPLTPGRRHPFTRSLIWTSIGALVPGLGLWATRHRRVGMGITAAFVVTIVAMVAKVKYDLGGTAALAVQPRVLVVLTWTLATLAMLWVLTIAGTHLATRPRRLTGAQRGVGAFAVGLLSFIIAAPLTVAASYAHSQSSFVSTVFKQGGDTRSQTRPTLGTGKDVWADKPRLNVLLLGADNTAYRDEKYPDEGIRTDTVMLASIDTANGNTVIIQLPRNLSTFPFPEGSALAKAYPNGYWDGVSREAPEFELNSVWKNVPQAHPELFKDTDYPGADAVKTAVEGTTGLKPDYFVLLSIDGLTKLIDAMGGVTVNVNGYIPVAQSSEQFKAGIPPQGGYIAPGENKRLSGYYAMWFARSRSQSLDPDRMARQSCVVKAVIDQANPATLITHYEAITKAGKDALLTDIPQEVAPALVQLALRMQGARTQRVLFGYPSTTLPNGEKFKPWDPDVAQMEQMIQLGIDKSQGRGPTPTPKPKPSATSTRPTPTPSAPSSSATPKDAAAGDLKDTCAWNPEAAAEAEANPPRDLGSGGVH